ncbi:ABC transporter permease subunit [Microbacterium sp. ET2]|uniref:ABC transporter permease subunit n=1 Tax=Microbacterium albipurpureum TaxID=3050384 RepID=UPI00259C9FAA|nr:ABC transporter permease subunit [Microbacterium sp. ET2 (Ac-2212)]WJL96624.1 ABC transporter permease subunit [Microbacterium sp. ET2 (Ac-2212)]
MTTRSAAPDAAQRVIRLDRVVAAEWIKLRSVRSTWWSYAILLMLTAGLGAQLSSVLSFSGMDGTPSQDAVQDMAVYAMTVSTDFTALVVSVLGVLVIAGEYGSGLIRTTLTAVPRRIPALVAKALVFGIVTFVASAVAFAVAVPISVALFSSNGIDIDVLDARYWMALLGAAAYLAMVGLIALAIGAILRNSAGGIAVAIALVLAAPLLVGLLSGVSQLTWLQNAAGVLPSEAGTMLFTYPTTQSWVTLDRPEAAQGWIVEPWQGAVVLGAWFIILFAVSAILLKRRDA